MRKLHRGLWEQAAHFLGPKHALDADGHGGRAMRDLMVFRAPNHLSKRMFEDAEEFVGYFGFAPKKTLQPLDPLEVGNNHAAGVATNVRNHKNFIPSFFQDQ